MDTNEIQKLEEALFKKGFGTALNERLEQEIASGKAEFSLEHIVQIGKDDVGYRLHFRRDEQRDKVYFNSYDVAIIKDYDAPGQTREHNFPTDRLITAMEAYRMLKHGLLVAVNKTLFNKEGQQYNAWLSLDTGASKDEYGNYPVLSYHENYYQKRAFNLKDELQQLHIPVKELESAQGLDNTEKALKKGNIVSVIIMLNGTAVKGNLVVNPKIGRVDVYDDAMQLLERPAKEKTVSEHVKNEKPADEKKAMAKPKGELGEQQDR